MQRYLTLPFLLLFLAIPGAVSADVGFIQLVSEKFYCPMQGEYRYKGDLYIHSCADAVWLKSPGGEFAGLDRVEPDRHWRMPYRPFNVPLEGLQTWMNGQWAMRILLDDVEHDYTFMMNPVQAGDFVPVPTLTSPLHDEVIQRDHTFTWDSNNAEETAYGFRLDVGLWDDSDEWWRSGDGWKTHAFGPFPPQWEPPHMPWTLEQDAKSWTGDNMPIGDAWVYLGYGVAIDIISDLVIPDGAPHFEVLTLAMSIDELDMTIVPEPGSLVVLGLGGLLLLRRREYVS
ncbi:MAG: PEP-CTERM sorting domain-containing protein [Phycisphaeraceae bacterium]|nr:PEP-CTERM sorting domain-containing protein [Phycisphaeraceae bacterium]